jgi:hypothetical protein
VLKDDDDVMADTSEEMNNRHKRDLDPYLICYAAGTAGLSAIAQISTG